MNPSEKACPYCGETIKAVAIRCKHCHADLAADPALLVITSSQPPPPVESLHPSAPAEPAESDVLDLLSCLVDKSLVVHDSLTGRFHMLESVRQYTRERMLESGDCETRRGRHRDFFLAQAEDAEPRFKTADQREWLERLEADHDNLLAAMEFSDGFGLPGVDSTIQ